MIRLATAQPRRVALRYALDQRCFATKSQKAVDSHAKDKAEETPAPSTPPVDPTLVVDPVLPWGPRRVVVAGDPSKIDEKIALAQRPSHANDAPAEGPRKPPRRSFRNMLPYETMEHIRVLATEKKMSISQLSRLYKVSHDTIVRILKSNYTPGETERARRQGDVNALGLSQLRRGVDY